MNVSDLQQFVRSLATLFASRQGQPQTDMVALDAALDPFKELSLPAFGSFLQLAKEYKDTGKITAPAAGRKQTSASKSTRSAAPKTPLKTRADAAAIQEAVDTLERLYSHAADPDLTYVTIETTVKQICDAFDQNALKEVAKGFKLTSGISSKKACLEKIEHKIKERKARNERGEVIAAAAKPVPPPEPTVHVESVVDLVEATVVDEQPIGPKH